MPLQITTPVEVVETKVVGKANYYSLLGVTFADRSEMGEGPWMTITWGAAFKDATSGKLTWVKQDSFNLTGVDLQAVLGTVVNGPLATQLKGTIYNMLVTKGIFPTGGTIS